ncbi:50S ribosomal protein L10 [bacterium]|nr:50S ribosomal protein L10 [bacterium]
MPTERKQKIIDGLVENFKTNKVVLITDYSGLDVERITNLRSKLKDNQCYMVVAKNRLIKLALSNLERNTLDEYLKGPTALVFSIEDPVAPAKILDKMIKEINKPQVKGMVIDDNILPIEYFSSLADLLPAEVLQSKLVGVLVSPIANFMALNQNLLRGLVIALNEIVNKQN